MAKLFGVANASRHVFLDNIPSEKTNDVQT